MRGKTLVLVPMLTASLLATTVALADDDLSSVGKVNPPAVVYLRGLIGLEKLKESNPDHALRAERIMADAEEICKPGPNEVQNARYAAKDVRCEGMLLRTSYPAQRQIGFTLDGVRYVALVAVKNGEGQLRRVPDVLDPPQ